MSGSTNKTALKVRVSFVHSFILPTNKQKVLKRKLKNGVSGLAKSVMTVQPITTADRVIKA